MATGRRKDVNVASIKKQLETKTQDEVITDLVKQKYKRPDLAEAEYPQTKRGEISKMLGQALTMMRWPKIDTNDAEQVAERINQYHQYCYENDIKPDMPGLGLALGVSRQMIWNWENGVDSNKPTEVRNALKRGREVNEYLMSQMMQNGKINPVSGIFLLKNNYGYKDQQDVVITPNNPLSDLDNSNARQKILDALPPVEE